MASFLLLLTPEQARLNKELFERAPAHLPPSGTDGIEPFRAQPFLNPVSSQNTEATLAVANGTVTTGYPPRPNGTIFADPNFHEDVISTFFTTAMDSVGYVPTSPVNDPEQEAIAFDSFLRELTRYGSYMPLVNAQRDSYEQASSDCGPLIKSVDSFIESVESIMGAEHAKTVATTLTGAIVSAIETMGSSSSEKVSKTLYSAYRVNGHSVNHPYPVSTIFWSSINMMQRTTGKSTVQRQKVEMMSYSYMILSPVVVANADALGVAAPVSVSQFVDAINANLPS